MKFLAALLVLCSAAALSAAESSPAKHGEGWYEPIDWSKETVPGRTGKFTDELKHPLKHNHVMNYLMFVPDTLPVEKHLGVVLCFHGRGGNETHIAPPIHDTFAKLGIAKEYVIAGLKSGGEAWGDADEASVLQCLDWIETVYPIDRRRVFIVGQSNGGWMVSWFGGRHQDRIAGVTRYCGPQPTAPQVKDPALTQTEYYIVHGDKDDQVRVDGSRELDIFLKQQGYRSVYREIDGAGHNDIVGNEPVREDVSRWMHALRHKQVPPSDADVRFLRQFAAAPKATELFALPATWDEIVRIGGQPAWQVVARACKHEQASVRAAAAAACARCVFAGDETVAALAKLADDKEASVRSAAIAALAVHANWRSDAADIALGSVAMRKKAAADDRLAAAAGVANALTLPLLGNLNDDPAAIQAVVALLDADAPELRTAAFAPLKVAVPNGLGYDPAADAAARKGPVAAWQAWFTERMASGEAGKPAKAAKK